MPATRATDPDDLMPFRHIVDQTPDAVIFADTGGVIRVWNRGAETCSGSPLPRRSAAAWT